MQENIELTCPNCKKAIGRIAESEFNNYIKRLTCPECKENYPSEYFLPGFKGEVAKPKPPTQQPETPTVPPTGFQEPEQKQEPAKQQVHAVTPAAEPARTAEEQEPAKQQAHATIPPTITQKPELRQTATPATTPAHDTTAPSSKFPQVAQINICTPNGKELTTKLEVRRNVIGRNQNYPTASGNNIRTMATILIDTEHKTMSREHLLIDVNLQREGGAIKYNYTASLYKQDVNDTLINNTKMKFGLSYFMKDKDQILFPDGTKLTFINPAEAQ